MITVTFLGTGTSQGVPFIGCTCPVCQSPDSRDKRLRSSVWIRDSGGTSVVIDTGPDFRYQMLRAGVKQLDALVYTHGHKDHVAGLDDVRAFNYWQQEAIPVFGTAATQEVLRREFHYVFNGDRYPGIPQLTLNTIHRRPFRIKSLTFLPVYTRHYQMEVLGFRVGDFTYITDANYISETELEKIKGSKVLVLNALRKEKHISHFNLEKAIAVARKTGAEHTYLTHISHQLGSHKDVSAELPAGIHLAFDGLEVRI